MNDINIIKRAMRGKYLKLRDDMPEDVRGKKSAAIAGHLYETPAYKSCREVFIFHNAGSEVDTRGVINRAIRDGKTVALPVVVKIPEKNMLFIQYAPGDMLIKNKFGIYEPEPDADKVMKSGDKTLIVAPGAVFSKDGRRVGYGGGYYDKYLSENIYLMCAGICFDLQIDEDVPEDEGDMRTDFVITESGVFGKFK